MVPSRRDLTRGVTVLDQIPRLAQLGPPTRGPCHHCCQFRPGQGAGVHVLITDPDAGAPFGRHDVKMRFMTIILAGAQNNSDAAEAADYRHSARDYALKPRSTPRFGPSHGGSRLSFTTTDHLRTTRYRRTSHLTTRNRRDLRMPGPVAVTQDDQHPQSGRTPTALICVALCRSARRSVSQQDGDCGAAR
jgi:hypothetical protein